MFGRLATGAEAERMNLVNYAVPVDQVLPKALELARELLELPPWAVRFTKSTVNIAIRQLFHQMMDASVAFEALTMNSADFVEGTKSFVERRKAKFTGR